MVDSFFQRKMKFRSLDWGKFEWQKFRPRSKFLVWFVKSLKNLYKNTFNFETKWNSQFCHLDCKKQVDLVQRSKLSHEKRINKNRSWIDDFQEKKCSREKDVFFDVNKIHWFVRQVNGIKQNDLFDFESNMWSGQQYYKANVIMRFEAPFFTF